MGNLELLPDNKWSLGERLERLLMFKKLGSGAYQVFGMKM